MIFYFAGSVEAEGLIPIHDDERAGVLFTFFDIPEKRFKRLKKHMRDNQKHIETKQEKDDEKRTI